MRGREFILGFGAFVFYFNGLIFFVLGVYLLLFGIFATRNFLQSKLWVGLLAVIGFIYKLIPNVIQGMMPSATSIPAWWTRFTYWHALVVLLFIVFGIFLWRIASGLRKRKKPARLLATIFSLFFAFLYLFLLILWTGGSYGALMFLISLVLVIFYSTISILLYNQIF